MEVFADKEEAATLFDLFGERTQLGTQPVPQGLPRSQVMGSKMWVLDVPVLETDDVLNILTPYTPLFLHASEINATVCVSLGWFSFADNSLGLAT